MLLRLACESDVITEPKNSVQVTSEAHLGSCQESMIDNFCEHGSRLKLVTHFTQ